MNTRDTIATKRRKTQMKEASFIQLDEQIISKYGSFNALKSQRTLFNRNHLDKYRDTSNNYIKYLRRKKILKTTSKNNKNHFLNQVATTEMILLILML